MLAVAGAKDAHAPPPPPCEAHFLVKPAPSPDAEVEWLQPLSPSLGSCLVSWNDKTSERGDRVDGSR